MKKLLQGAILPFTLFSFIVVMVGCDPSFKDNADHEKSDQATQIESSTETTTHPDSTADTSLDAHRKPSELKNGNLFYIARDVADMQMNAGNYVTELKQSQQDLQQAIDLKDQQQLQTSVTTLQKQLKGFNQALINLDLKSQEINDIRENIVSANTQVLKSSLMNGDLDISKVNFKKLEQQMNTVQSEMLKLATMLIPENQS